MQYRPHKYQEFATKFIEEHSECAVLLDMGLGKTAITLQALMNLLFDSFLVRRVLVIAPLRVAKTTWPDEVKKWDEFQMLKVAVAVGDVSTRSRALEERADITVINRENVAWLIEKSGFRFDFDMVVIDELSSFKNYQSKRFKALMTVRPFVKRVVGLTGTPASNGLMDLFAEMKLIDKGKRLGRFITKYRNEYFVPDKTNGVVVYSYKPLPDAEKRIYNKISDITISMKATEHLDMPRLVNTTQSVSMSAREQKLYDTLKKQLVLPFKDKEITALNAAALSNKLCQMANGAAYGDDGECVQIHERKLDALEDAVEALNGNPALVAYWFKHDLERIKTRLDKLEVPYRELKTENDIREWNAGRVPIGLIHPASAGHGLNLQTGGHHLIWFGLTWSLELYQQTVARLYRQGQTSKSVVVTHIICAGTIDEDVLLALKRKDKTQSSLIDAVKARL